MKNRIKKRRENLNSPILSEKLPKTNQSSFWYNLASVAIIIEVLVGAILGIALCFGFFFAFFVVRVNLLVSFGIFLIILIFAAFFVLILKYMFILVILKIREIGFLERIARR